MSRFLRQSTASQSRLIGPFIDDTDFKTVETGLTIANTDIKLSANGAASANKNSGGGTHRMNGEYGVTFDATDTATVGELSGSVVVAGALPVFFTFAVLEEAVYDALFAASAPGYCIEPTFPTTSSLKIQKGKTSRSVIIRIAQNNGQAKTGVAYNTSGLVLKYWRSRATSIEDIQTISLANVPTLLDDWVSGGFTEIGAGLYRVDVPDAAFVTGANEVLLFGTLTNCKIQSVCVELVNYDPTDAATLGLTGLAGAAAADARVVLALPAFAPDVAGGLFTSNQGPRIIHLQSTGNDSNSGLSPSSPVATITQANTNARDGDYIMIMGSNTTTGFTSGKRLNWRGYREGTAKLTCSAALSTLKLNGSAAAGSTIKGITFEQTYAGAVASISHIAPLHLASTANVDIEDATCVVTSGAVTHGIDIQNSTGIRLRRVIGTGYARGLSIYDSTVDSAFGVFTGGESGAYLDCEATPSKYHSLFDEFIGTNATATPIAGTWAGCQSILYECHDATLRNRVRLIGPRFTVLATHASFPRDVAVIYSGAPSFAVAQGTPDPGDSINNGDFVIEGGGVDFYTNSGSGDSFTFRAVGGHEPSKFKVTNCNHDESLNDGDVQVINSDIADTLEDTSALSSAATVSPFNVDKEHTWTFASKLQTTASNIISEKIGFNALLSMDFSTQIPPRTSINSITSATFANITGIEPTVSSSAVNASRKEAHIMVDTTSATAGTYTLSVTILTADGQTFKRNGSFTIS